MGERAGNTALNKVYGKKVPCEGPSFKAFKPSGSALLIQLEHAKDLTTTDGKEPAQFEIAGADGAYHPATAEITNRKGSTAVIRLTSPEVKSPQTRTVLLEPLRDPQPGQRRPAPRPPLPHGCAHS